MSKEIQSEKGESQNFFRKLAKQKSGVALIMVMGAITIMLAIIASFTFETEVNKLKVYNKQDLVQARLLAESGIDIAFARMKIYKEVLTKLEKDPSKKKIVSAKALDLIWSFRFLYPIPLPANADIMQRNLVEEFHKKSILQGQMEVSIQNISQLININLLYFNKRKIEEAKKQNPNPSNPNDPNNPQDPEAPPPSDGGESTDGGSGEGQQDQADQITAIQKVLTEMMERKLDDKRESDESFDEKYGSVTGSLLIKELKFYINEAGAFSDSDSTEIEGLYNDVTPKHAPLSSLSELYLLQGWRDAHVDLIKDDVTVHGSRVLDLNKITKTGLKILLPDLSEEQIKDFFAYRDNPTKPHRFETLQDFSDYIVNQAKFMEKTEFDQRIEQFEKAGIRLGSQGLLFRVISQGKYKNANAMITAYITIPAEEERKPPVKVQADGQCPEGYEIDKKSPQANRCLFKIEKDDKGRPKPLPLIYFEPRVVEMLNN